MFTFFSNPLLCLKQDDFKITQRDERKDTKDYIKVSLVLKMASWFEILTSTRYYSNFCYRICTVCCTFLNRLSQAKKYST